MSSLSLLQGTHDCIKTNLRHERRKHIKHDNGVKVGQTRYNEENQTRTCNYSTCFCFVLPYKVRTPVPGFQETV